MLPLPAKPDGVTSHHPAQRVANLVAVELRALWNAEIGAILQTGKANFITDRKASWIRDRIIRAECRDGVQEPVPVKDEAVHHPRGKEPRPVDQWRVEAVQG